VAVRSGGLIPPVGASSAFILAEVTGIPYLIITKAAIIPALLYLLEAFIQIHLLWQRYGLALMETADILRLGPRLRNGSLFIAPLPSLVSSLFVGYITTLTAVVGIIMVPMVRQSAWLSPAALASTLITACRCMVPVVAVCATAVLLVRRISMTGLSGKVSILTLQFASDSMDLSQILVATMSILLGMGMPTPSADIMAAVLTATFLIDQGLTPLMVHLYLLLFAVLPVMTSSVAVAAFTASSLAETNSREIAAQAVLLALPTFIISFFFAYRYKLLGQRSHMQIFAAFIGVTALANTSH